MNFVWPGNIPIASHGEFLNVSESLSRKGGLKLEEFLRRGIKKALRREVRSEKHFRCRVEESKEN